MALLLAKEASISKEYADFLDTFSKESITMLSKYLDIDKHAIDQEPYKQPPYRLIYSLDLVKLEILRTYIKTNLANKFI